MDTYLREELCDYNKWMSDGVDENGFNMPSIGIEDIDPDIFDRALSEIRRLELGLEEKKEEDIKPY